VRVHQRGHARRVGDPPARAAVARGPQQDEDRQHAQEHQGRVGARLDRVEDRERAERQQRGADQRAGPSDRAQPEQVRERHGRGAEQDRREVDGCRRVADLDRQPRQHEVQRRRVLDRGPAAQAVGDHVEHAGEAAVDGLAVRVELVAVEALVDPSHAQRERDRADDD
jgi:hypothetical protein